MNDFIFFLGRFHVLVLHLPIGILLLTVVLDLLSRQARHAYLAQALPLCWAATALTATLTVVLGLLHFSEGGFEGPSATAHRNYGISVAACSILVWLLASRRQDLYLRVHFFSDALLVFLVAMTGHYGGNLTHGSTYLVEYAPEPLRALAGLPTRRQKLTDVNDADPWHDVVNPLLQARCLSCHNVDKRRGQLDLSSLSGLLDGGEHGAVVISGAAADSDLYLRVTLPPDHEDVMPAEGKTPLTDRQVRILGWWIDAGMPVDTSVAKLQVDPTIVDLLATEVGLSTGGQSSPGTPLPAVAADTLRLLSQNGWLARLQSQQSNGLIISLASPGTPVSPLMLETLNEAASSVIELNLANADLNDSFLRLLIPMPALEILNLGGNQLGDEGMALLTEFQSLRVLNLHGNAGITDAGLTSLMGLSDLNSLYLWGTTTTPAGTDRLTTTLPGISIHAGSSEDTKSPAE